MEQANRAAFEFTLTWQSDVASHCDRYFINKLNLGRDIFPSSMAASIQQLQPGASCTASFPAGELVPAAQAERIITFPDSEFEQQQRNLLIEPKLGRFYPQSFAWAALNSHQGNFQPFRIIAHADGKLIGDTNHPLARYPLTLNARYAATLPPLLEHGGADIAALVTDKGPGLQAPYPSVATDFYTTYPFTRSDDREDTVFYTNPRMVNHLDKTAIQQVTALYGKLLKPGMKVLDLMSSCVSHLPDALTDLHVTGLGMNQAELAANPRLHATVVQDLNQNPLLAFTDNAFDAVICTVSVEYLTQPLEVMRELARVTRAGGVVIMGFSDRWFPTKAIEVWANLHPFERQGLVLDYFLKTAAFSDLHTESIRGLPRPFDDPHSRKMPNSDPIFAVWGFLPQ